MKRLAALAATAAAALVLSGCYLPGFNAPDWNASQHQGAAENVQAGLPTAVRWCFRPDPTPENPGNLVRWDVDSDVLVAFRTCEEAVKHAAGTMCVIGDDGAKTCQAFGLPPIPPTTTNTWIDYAPVDPPGLLP